MARLRAPELPQNLPWLNCDRPLSLKALRGQIVLLDFWTYGCINCLHVIPDLHYLAEQYTEHLTIIGVHTAKFDHEQNLDSIRQAILRYGITHPVVVDRDRTLWDQYAIRAYPTFVLIDPQGYIVSSVSGEGRRFVLDRLIQHLISEHAGKGTLSPSSIREIVPPQPSLTALAFPGKILADEPSDTLFIADTGHHRIIMTTLAGTLKATIGNGLTGWQDGDWNSTQFASPQGMALDSSRNLLYVADAGNHRIRQIDLSQQVVTTLAGNGLQSRSLFPYGGKALDIELNSPWDLTLLGNQLYIAMAGSHQIWVMDLAERRLQTLIGTGAEFCVDGTPDVAAFAQPHGLTTDRLELFVADSETSTIRAITLSEPPIARTVCGQGELYVFGDRDGIGSSVQLQHCAGVVATQGKVFIADTYNHKIKHVNPVTGECHTLAGTGTAGAQDGAGAIAQFSEPSGLAYAHHQLYVADTNNHAIRCIDLDSLTVTILSIPSLCPPGVCLPANL
ncbi:MAG TPA: redoxin domain-containing protein [Leptolyngbyaceae cyanobacterium M33_DOE_097]|uniref:Redoxin domain-containing protein n=1 Tax=Oscillatoriales cyanobacterium SpSt-418 TaxID=2282169 RepID=A0A7C3KDW7_9CYAN|nr:redoxin domain-containing protein [Leptolyngbyaceae cyanobacterium M33_DOE_097]